MKGYIELEYMLLEENFLHKIKLRDIEEFRHFKKGKERKFEYIKLKTVDDIQILDCHHLFEFFVNLVELDLSEFKTFGCENMDSMFIDCYKLENLNLSGLITDKVTDMYQMFQKCYSLKTINISNFNMSNVKDLRYMFARCYNLEKIKFSKEQIINATNLKGMFDSCYKLKSINLSNIDTEKIYDISFMFFNCENLEEILVSEKWKIEKNKIKSSQAFSNCNKLSKEKYTVIYYIN